jgi:hypothetical protein
MPVVTLAVATEGAFADLEDKINAKLQSAFNKE